MASRALFDLELGHGRCVGVRIPVDPAEVATQAEETLLPEERAYAATLSAVRGRTWVGGRVALREALARAGLVCASPVLSDDRGAPRLPPGLRASISHKEAVAVALVDGSGRAGCIGVDVEVDSERKHDIARRVLTVAEQTEIAALGDRDRARAVTVRFSAKEAIYKALDPFVRRYVAFDEVAVSPLPGGGAEVVASLRPAEGPFVIAATWRVFDGLVLTTARVSLSGTS